MIGVSGKRFQAALSSWLEYSTISRKILIDCKLIVDDNGVSQGWRGRCQVFLKVEVKFFLRNDYIPVAPDERVDLLTGLTGVQRW